MDVNVNGVLYTAQAVGRQMRRFGKPGSIILIASMSGSITNKVKTLFPSYIIVITTGLKYLFCFVLLVTKGHKWVSYNSSKAAVIQMARNMACELGSDGIRVNSLSPGYIYTKFVGLFLF